MAKALVIKGVDFSVNKLTTVTLIEEIPCTSISLNKNSAVLEGLGTTETLVATVLPINTTDAISWSSSDSRVASVNNYGVVTINGAGTATITATCGAKSAQCTITTTVTLAFETVLQGQYTPRGYSVGVDSLNAFVQFSSTTDSNYYGYAISDVIRPKGIYNLNDKYPIYFGHANSLVITAPSNIKVGIVLTDSTKAPAQSELGYQFAKWLMPSDNGVASVKNPGNRTIDNIPSDADSVCISFRKTTNDLTLQDLASISIVAQ